METYELTVVLPDKATATKKKEAVKFVEALVKVAKGKIEAQDDWGAIDLAYPIKKNSVGTFLVFTLNLPKESLKDVKDKVRVEEQFIRYLLVRVDSKNKK